MYQYLSVSLHVCIITCLYHFPHVWLPVCITTCLYHYPVVSLPVSITTCLYHYLSLSPPVCITTSLYRFLSVSLPFFITTCLYKYLSVAIISVSNILSGITLLPYLHDIQSKLPQQGDSSEQNHILDWCPKLQFFWTVIYHIFIF